MAESCTSASCIIFSCLQLASLRAKALYNLMNFCIHMTFLRRNPVCFGSQAGSRTFNFLPAEVIFSNKIHLASLYFILLTVIRYNRCRGRSNPHYFIWYHLEIFICSNFDVQNRSAEFGLENRYDSAKIGMVGISASCGD